MSGVTLITPTGDRPQCFRLCEHWMRRQTYDGTVQWIVVDDGHSPTRATQGQIYIRREPQEGDPPHTLCANLRLALPRVAHDRDGVSRSDHGPAARNWEPVGKGAFSLRWGGMGPPGAAG